ncbi:MAG: hypothetical protein ACLU9S_16775 [Oscillospiraceae bacterium]
MTEDTDNRALRLKTLGTRSAPQAYPIFPVHRHDRNRGVCQYLPLCGPGGDSTLKEWKAPEKEAQKMTLVTGRYPSIWSRAKPPIPTTGSRSETIPHPEIRRAPPGK